jgi:tetratricopeptide (TPR) repeat protein
VADTFDQAVGRGLLTKAHVQPFESALLYHYAAVASARQGRVSEAKELWTKSHSICPGLDLVCENLDDLRRPAGEREGPWPFSMNQWFPRRLVDDMRDRLEPASRHKDNQRVREATSACLAEHRDLIALAPALLDRGDPAAREFVIHLAGITEDPELVSALREFVFGQRGSDQVRMDASNVLRQKGLVPSGPVRTWSQGEWKELLMLAWDIYTEPVQGKFPPEVAELSQQAMKALRLGHADEAERLFKESVDRAPDVPELRNNLAAAYLQMGRKQETRRLIEEIHAQFPDYLFGRTNLAQFLAADGETDKARKLLEPLLSLRRLHVSEFASLCGAQIQLAVCEARFDVARSWYSMLKQIAPNHPAAKQWKALHR